MYIDGAYYRNEFKGEPVDDADFPALCQRAGEIVEELTLYRLTETSFKAMSADMQKRVKDAICAQIEYLDANGGADMDMGSDISGATLGKFSYSGNASSNEGASCSIYSPRAERILWPTGLTYRGGAL